MNKIVMFILILTISVLIFGCTKNSNDSNALSGGIEELIEASDDFNFDSGTLEIDDDTTTLEFEREEVANGIFMEKKVEFVETDEGYDGTITITFDGEGDYSHIETIPKSFAAHVDDLVFSIEPDEIIEEDPVVKWEITKSQEIIKEITIRAGGVAVKKDPISAAMIAVFPDVEFSDEAQSLALGSVLSSTYDFAFIKSLNYCKVLPQKTLIQKAYRDACIIKIMINWPEKFSDKDCVDINFNSLPMKNTCLAIANAEHKYCKMDHYIIEQKRQEQVEQNCRDVMAYSYMNKCVEKNEICKVGAATWSHNLEMCDSLSSYYNKLCLALVNKNDIYCQEISDSTVRSSCCSTLNTNQNDIDDCALDDEEPQALEEDLPPLPEWMDCPIPKNAKLMKWNQQQTSGYEYKAKDSMKLYGPSIKYWGKDYEIPMKFYCYDEEGKKHGKFQIYTGRTGLLDEEGSYYHGVYDGVVKEYSGEHLIKLTTYKKGRKDGYAEEYIYNGENVGTLKQKGYYVDGSRDGEWESYDKEGKLRGTIVYTGATSHFIPI
jgi:hypothetical protein